MPPSQRWLMYMEPTRVASSAMVACAGFLVPTRRTSPPSADVFVTNSFAVSRHSRVFDRSMMCAPLRLVNMYGSIRGCHRLVGWPKCTLAANSARRLMGPFAGSAGDGVEGTGAASTVSGVVNCLLRKAVSSRFPVFAGPLSRNGRGLFARAEILGGQSTFQDTTGPDANRTFIRCLASVPELAEPPPVGGHGDGVRPVASARLGEYPGHVVLDRLDAQAQFPGNDRAGMALRYAGHDLPFPLRKRVRPAACSGPAGGAFALLQFADQELRGRPAPAYVPQQHALAAGNPDQHVFEYLPVDVRRDDGRYPVAQGIQQRVFNNAGADEYAWNVCLAVLPGFAKGRRNVVEYPDVGTKSVRIRPGDHRQLGAARQYLADGLAPGPVTNRHMDADAASPPGTERVEEG